MHTIITLAGGVILDEKSRILLIHRNTEARKQWELPGGKVEPTEDAKSACIRELKEEIGVTVVSANLIGNIGFSEDRYKMHYTVFLCEAIKTKPKLLEGKFDDLKFFSRKELLECDSLSANMRNFCKNEDLLALIA